MIKLKNCFQGIGKLIECRVDLFPKYFKIIFTLEINRQTITFRHIGFNTKPLQFLTQLHPKVDGFVFLNGNDKYYTLTKANIPTYIFVSGNIFCNKNNDVFFNAESFSVVNCTQEYLDIEIDGVFISHNKFMNIINDMPIVLNLRSDFNVNNYVLRVNLSYVTDYIHERNIIKPLYNIEKFSVKSISKTNQILSDKQIKDYILEWEIRE